MLPARRPHEGICPAVFWITRRRKGLQAVERRDCRYRWRARPTDEVRQHGLVPTLALVEVRDGISLPTRQSEHPVRDLQVKRVCSLHSPGLERRELVIDPSCAVGTQRRGVTTRTSVIAVVHEIEREAF